MSDIETTNALIKQAWKLKSEGRDKEAEDLLIDFARAAKGGAEVQVALARTFHKFADHAAIQGSQSGQNVKRFMDGEAFDSLEHASKLAPNDAALALETAQAAKRYNFVAASFDHVRRSLNLDKSNSDAWLLLSELLFSRSDWQVAEECRRNAARLNAGLADQLNLKAMEPTVRPKGPRPTRR